MEAMLRYAAVALRALLFLEEFRRPERRIYAGLFFGLQALP